MHVLATFFAVGSSYIKCTTSLTTLFTWSVTLVVQMHSKQTHVIDNCAYNIFQLLLGFDCILFDCFSDPLHRHPRHCRTKADHQHLVFVTSSSTLL